MASKYVATTGNDSNAGTSGSPYLTLGKAGSVISGGDTIYQASGSYSITSATTNIAGGCLSLPAGSISANTRLIGTDASWNPLALNSASRPVNTASGISSFTLIALANGCYAEGIVADGASLTSSTCITGLRARFFNCLAKNASVRGLYTSSAEAIWDRCGVTGCSSQAMLFGYAFGCASYSNTCPGFSGVFSTSCLAANNSGATSDGFYIGAFAVGGHHNCVAYNNGRHGFNWSASAIESTYANNCHAEGHVAGGAAGFAADATDDWIWLVNCSSYNNTSDTSNLTAGNLILFQNNASFTGGSPLVSPGSSAGSNFGWNTTAGAGALMRAAGLIGAFPFFTGTIGYEDRGPFQHQDPAGGGGLFDLGNMGGNCQG